MELGIICLEVVIIQIHSVSFVRQLRSCRCFCLLYDTLLPDNDNLKDLNMIEMK